MYADFSYVATQSSVVQSSGRQEQQPPVDEDAAPQLQTIVALKGQLLHWRLLVANSGKAALNACVYNVAEFQKIEPAI